MRSSRFRIARLQANGTADSGFIPPSINSAVLDVAVQPNGQVLIGGQFTSV